MAKKAQSQILQVNVTLVGIRPPIWRRLLVASSISLRKFHDTLQIAIGWTDSHLHMFLAGEDSYGFPDPDGQLDWMKNDARAKLGQRPRVVLVVLEPARRRTVVGYGVTRNS